jgi:hypothetical protein
MTPNYLTPDTVDELYEIFAEESMLQLSNFLSPKFAERLHDWVQSKDSKESEEFRFHTSRPPHKHRYRYMTSRPPGMRETNDVTSSPFELVLNDLLPSLAFLKWLSLVTGLTLQRCSAIARRFRRGLDYQLAQAFEQEDPQLEYCLCITPTAGWAGDDENLAQNGETSKNGAHPQADEEDNVGGYELYMAGDDPDSDFEGSEQEIGETPSAERQIQQSTKPPRMTRTMEFFSVILPAGTHLILF